jgi:hypothetical protein
MVEGGCSREVSPRLAPDVLLVGKWSVAAGSRPWRTT